jgi:hypothetical protein
VRRRRPRSDSQREVGARRSCGITAFPSRRRPRSSALDGGVTKANVARAPRRRNPTATAPAERGVASTTSATERLGVATVWMGSKSSARAASE